VFNNYTDVQVHEQRRRELIERAKLDRLAREAEANPARARRGLGRLLEDLRRGSDNAPVREEQATITSPS
jgi:hypothetical protein